MKKAVVTGAAGLVGRAVVKYLISSGIEVLCLGRGNLNPAEVKNIFGTEANYLNLPMENIMSLERHINSIGWSSGEECVFFNFAWAGRHKLTDGDLEIQLDNAVMAVNAVQAAKSIGCTKFINAGTIEETFAEQWVIANKGTPYQSAQANYAIAKLASRDLCKITAYIQKIDYIHTRLSVPLEFDLSNGSYVALTLKKIANGKSYEKPLNKQLFDIISTEDVARAFYLIGQSGINKADYYIGTSKPATLVQYFDYFEGSINGIQVVVPEVKSEGSAALFDTSKLLSDTGFQPALKFQDISKYVKNV